MSTLLLSNPPNEPSTYDLSYLNCRPQDPEIQSKLHDLPAIRLYGLLYGRLVKSPVTIANHMRTSLPQFIADATVTQLNCEHPLTAADILDREYQAKNLAEFGMDFDRSWRICHIVAQPGIFRMELAHILDPDGLPIAEPKRSDYVSLSLEDIEALHISFCALSINETAEIIEFHFGRLGTQRSVKASSQTITRWASERHYQAIAKAAQKFQ